MRNWLVLGNCFPNRRPVSGNSSRFVQKTKNWFFLGFFAGLLCSAFVFTATTIALVLLFQSAVFSQDDDLSADERTKDGDATSVQRPIGEIRRDVNAFLKNSKSEDLDLQVGGIIDLCYMHREIVNDPRFATNSQLKSSRAIAASRLKKYLKTVEIEKARKSRRQRKELNEQNKRLLAGQNPTPKTQTTADRSHRSVRSPDNSSEGAEISENQMVDDAMFESLSAMGGFTGGPAQIFGYLSGNFAPPWDHGEELVALIESVIDPDNWQSAGGSHIIKYYRPSRIIIVGASSRVHEDLTNMLRNLRRLSR